MRITCNVVGSLNEAFMLVQNVKEWVLKRARKEKELEKCKILKNTKGGWGG